MSDLTTQFPDPFPMEEVRVEDEELLFEVVEYNNSKSIKWEYVPQKSPLFDVESIIGQLNGSSYQFSQGTDFEVRDLDNDGRLETIDWDIGGDRPDDNTTFEVTYLCQSVFYRYVDSYEQELHTFQDRIERSIDSHYVDTASQTGLIDDFEDEQYVEYEVQAGSDPNVVVQSNEVIGGNWALRLTSSSAGNPVRIASTSGLPRYPIRGDTMSYFTRFEDADDISRADLLYSEESGNHLFYRVEIDNANDQLSIYKNGQTKITTKGVNFSSYQDTWLKVDVEIKPIGTITADVQTQNGVTIETVSITDTSYDTGGVRWEAENASGQSSVYFDQARTIERTSSDLDRVGAIFGELGRRRGRSDNEYQTFLRSIVKSFGGRGTVGGIKFAISSALNIDESQINFSENFQENEYTIALDDPFPPHEVVTITELAELADPSGVEFASVTYNVADEEAQIQDKMSFTVGQPIKEQMSVDDAFGVDANLTTIDENTTVDDSPFVDRNLTTVGDDLTSDDTVQNVNTTNVNWDDGDWDSMDWATEHN